MTSKFNLKKKKTTVQLTDESVLFIRVISNKSMYKFDKDIRSIKKWEFHLFSYEQTDSLPKNIEKFRNKFMKLF